MTYVNSPFGDLERRRAQLEQIRQNTARLVKTQAHYRTSGVGEFRDETYIAFDCTFVELPCFTSGFSVESSTDVVAGRFPRVSVGVYDWRTNTRGFYTGAWIFFVVDTAGFLEDAQVNYDIVHHLSWEGIGMKDLPGYLLEDA